MRIASFNVESLFERPVAMNPKTKASGTGTGPLAEWKPGASVLAAYAQLNTLLAKNTYDAADKAAIVELLKQLGLRNSDESKWAVLRQNRGKLLQRSSGKDPFVVANGRADW